MKNWALILVMAVCAGALFGRAEAQNLQFATIDRPPFSEQADGDHTGFSIDLMRAIAADLGREVEFRTFPDFGEMLAAVEAESVDGAIANISITASREEMMDFSQPIFAAGLQIMVPDNSGGNPFLRALFTRDVGLAILLALAALFACGMLMWLFERRAQPYFDREAKDALFPSFWWALNLVVNGGFEERMPQSRGGRFFAVVLVIASLFLVSIFVAAITAAVTVDALQGSVTSINDLDDRRVGTVGGSTAAEFLAERDLSFRPFDTPGDAIRAFEAGDLEAVVFDAPILAFYVQNQQEEGARLLDRIYRPENYGIALPTGSALREPINQSLLRLRENGTYDALVDRWFGPAFRN